MVNACFESVLFAYDAKAMPVVVDCKAEIYAKLENFKGVDFSSAVGNT